MLEKLTKEELLQIAVDVNVPPIELRFNEICGCYSRKPVAYRTYTLLNSILLGTVLPKDYEKGAKKTVHSVKLAEWSIENAMKSIGRFVEKGREIGFISVKVPDKMATGIQLYSYMKALIKKNGFPYPEKLCLEFSPEIMKEDPKKVRLALLDMKLLHVKTMISADSLDFPVMRFTELPFDYVILDKETTEMADEVIKGRTVSGLIGYIRSLDIEVIGNSISREDAIHALYRSDAFGYLPKEGTKDVLFDMTEEQAIIDREEED